ncbi:methylglyoxal reductase (NADPH-dependent) gre2 [Didymella heteroderae]|uniref:Methylglyoxal reductase (NADPH-dependent) gre2 n=1 Tax=Didymella heteroderae TaxID=1769908 RepID=A0A9P5C278_9PLEO|nr:methylglyoxal reductase (NADPH-dependent) gre2 [Didymella heteroderae]
MKVLFTGSTGFIGRHCLGYLLHRGHAVTITVRNEAKGKQSLSDNVKFSDALSYAVVPDMISPGAFDTAVQVRSFDAVIHMASPFNYSAEDVKRDMIDPAVRGTTEILNAIKDFAPTVKRVVITSSFAAVINFGEAVRNYTADVWNPISMEQALSGGQLAYVGSKTFAERAAWDFIEKEQPGFTLSTINPVMVFGPVSYPLKTLDAVNTSNAVFKDIITGKWRDEIPSNTFKWVDVRDVALAHVRAIEVAEAGGKRFLAAAGGYSNVLLARIVKKKMPDLMDKLPERIEAVDVAEDFTIDTSPMEEMLGIQFRSLEESVTDAIQSLIQVKG